MLSYEMLWRRDFSLPRESRPVESGMLLFLYFSAVILDSDSLGLIAEVLGRFEQSIGDLITDY